MQPVCYRMMQGVEQCHPHLWRTWDFLAPQASAWCETYRNLRVAQYQSKVLHSFFRFCRTQDRTCKDSGNLLLWNKIIQTSRTLKLSILCFRNCKSGCFCSGRPEQSRDSKRSKVDDKVEHSRMKDSVELKVNRNWFCHVSKNILQSWLVKSTIFWTFQQYESMLVTSLRVWRCKPKFIYFSMPQEKAQLCLRADRIILEIESYFRVCWRCFQGSRQDCNEKKACNKLILWPWAFHARVCETWKNPSVSRRDCIRLLARLLRRFGSSSWLSMPVMTPSVSKTLSAIFRHKFWDFLLTLGPHLIPLPSLPIVEVAAVMPRSTRFTEKSASKVGTSILR